jgi:hypothetical protein
LKVPTSVPAKTLVRSTGGPDLPLFATAQFRLLRALSPRYDTQ